MLKSSLILYYKTAIHIIIVFFYYNDGGRIVNEKIIGAGSEIEQGALCYRLFP